MNHLSPSPKTDEVRSETSQASRDKDAPPSDTKVKKMEPLTSEQTPKSPSSFTRSKTSLTGPVSVSNVPAPIVPQDVMMRATIRRTMAEQNPAASPFQPVGPIERFKWLLAALFSSRSFQEIAFQKTRRFKVDEVYLLRRESFTLISYASSDPVRHTYPRKIDYDLRRLRKETQEATQKKLARFQLPNHRNAIIRERKYSLLVAVTRGPENEFFEADLDYIHGKIEHQAGKRLADEVSNFTFPLQPLLEDCLLIQSPSAPS